MKTILVLILAATGSLFADIRLPSIISDNMVLLADAKANLWGWADPGEKVTVKFGKIQADTLADENGTWAVKLENLKPSESGDLIISGKNTLTIKNAIAGEVWLGSGQSNMEWNIKNSGNPIEEIAACNYPNLRMFTVFRKQGKTPLQDVIGKWEIATPENAPNFSAVGYYFSRELLQKRKVPVGFIHVSWGGTPVEVWMSEGAMDSNPAFGEHLKKKIAAYPQVVKDYETALAAYKINLEKAKAEGRPTPSAPWQQPSPDSPYVRPSALYNGMIAPLTPYSIRGAIWYQGESNEGPLNLGSMELYAQLFQTMIVSWRREFARAQNAPLEEMEFPFLFVQLANFHGRRDHPSDSYWAQIREAQFASLETPRTGMAVAIDIGEAGNIHPKNKQEVGRRLALSALAQVYYQEIEFSGPLYTGMQIEDEKIRLNFSHSTDIKSSNAGPMKGFAIAGEDRKFFWADATVQGDHVIVSSPNVPSPVAVRYAWADNPECNLINASGLPASPFRSDRWPQDPK